MDMRMARWFWSGAVALAMVVAAFGTADAQVPAETGTVRVVHGLRGLVADVYLDGTLVLPTFQPERSTDPLPIPAGVHLVEIRSAGAASTETPLLTQNVTVPAGFVGSLVAHLNGAGQPTLTAFADDLTAVPAGESRVVVRHAAAAEQVNVLLNDEPRFTAVAPQTEAGSVLGAGDYELAVTPAAGGAPIASPQTVQYPDGTANFMYLIGSQADGTLGWAAVQVADLQTAPLVIQTGDGSTEGSDGAPTLAIVAARRSRARGRRRRPLGAVAPHLTTMRRTVALAALLGLSACAGATVERRGPGTNRRGHDDRRPTSTTTTTDRRGDDDDDRRSSTTTSTVPPTAPTVAPIVTYAADVGILAPVAVAHR